MTLRVLSLNVWDLPFGLARHAPARLAAIGDRFADFDTDVIALQEVWTRRGRQILLRAARRIGYSHVWHHARSLAGSGLLLLSKHPIQQTTFVRYTAAGLPQRIQHADYYGGKGFVIAEIETDPGPVAIVATHLHASYVEPGRPDEYTGIRTAQIIQLAHHLADLDRPLVLVGDLNCAEYDPEYEVLLGLTGLADAGDAAHRNQPTVLADHPYRAPGATARRIDHVLYRRGSAGSIRMQSIHRVLDEPLRLGGEPGAYSDHAGLLAEFAIEPAEALDTSAPAPPATEAAIRQARVQLELGRAICAARIRREAAGSTVSSVAGIGTLFAAHRMRSAPRKNADPTAPRRGFLRSLMITLGGLGLGGGSAAGLLAASTAHAERAAYAEAARMLGEFEASWRRRDRLAPP